MFNPVQQFEMKTKLIKLLYVYAHNKKLLKTVWPDSKANLIFKNWYH